MRGEDQIVGDPAVESKLSTRCAGRGETISCSFVLQSHPTQTDRASEHREIRRRPHFGVHLYMIRCV